nr:AzlD domain-containing protein [Mammaliicoccus sp. Marseille-Q6498]
MTVSTYLFIIIAGCFVLTWLIRVSPFALFSKIDLPNGVIKWLQFVPVCLFTALILESMLNQEGSAGYTLNIESILVAIPTVVIAIVTRSLTVTVILGMILIAVVRLFY